jgi:hypothetical protein
MDQNAATQYVSRELGRHTQRNDIILRLCEQLKCSWPDVEKFIRYVEQDNRKAIAVRKSPMLILIGIGTIIVGLATAGCGLYELTHGVLVIGILTAPTPTPLIVLVGLGMIGGGGYGVLREIGTLTRR